MLLLVFARMFGKNGNKYESSFSMRGCFNLQEEIIIGILKHLNGLIWGVPVLIMILGVGLYLSIQTHFAQIRLLPKAVFSFVRRFWKSNDVDGVSPYQALCTALAATVGTGNIVGVAGAIAIGGPGSIFWMWVCALLGMITKFAEATLAVRYRVINRAGEVVGGPMYMIKQTMPRFGWMASVYCFFGVIAAFGVGNATQINAVIGGVNSVISYFGGRQSLAVDLFLGMILALLILFMLLGGARRIGQIAERLVPYAAVGYLLLCMCVLIGRFQAIPCAFSSILTGALTPKAITGGVIGSAFTALRIGASRGVFTNEAGMGTASIAHASANVAHPVEQGLMGIVEVFLDTIIMCTMTALAILCSGVPIVYGYDTGVYLTTEAFSNVLGQWVCIPISVFLCCFAFATVLGWGLYGVRCAQFLFGIGSWKIFVYLQAIIVMISVVLGTGTIWMLSETVNGLMAIPNLVVLAYLAPELKHLVTEYNDLLNRNIDKSHILMVK